MNVFVTEGCTAQKILACYEASVFIFLTDPVKKKCKLLWEIFFPILFINGTKSISHFLNIKMLTSRSGVV